jgi:hypothetical protein
MKTLVLSLLTIAALSSPALAADKDFDLSGRVTVVDVAAKTFTVTTLDSEEYTFASTPSTEYEHKRRFMKSGKFADLQVGDWVEVEYRPGRKLQIAKEVEIYQD